MMTNRKQMETVRIKAITEFLVQADMQEPIAKIWEYAIDDCPDFNGK